MPGLLQLLAQTLPTTAIPAASSAAVTVSASAAQTSAVLPPVGLAPMAILSLCALAAVGVGLLVPSDRPVTLRRIGGALAAVAGLILAVLLIRQADRIGIAGETGAYFWAFSAIAIASAVRVITHPRPVYSALYFVLTVFASAGLFVLLQAEFMAAALVLIYAGAVLVTYVFVIMLAAESTGGTGSAAQVAEADRVSRDPFLAGAVGFALLGVLLLVTFDRVAMPSREKSQALLRLGGSEITTDKSEGGSADRSGAFRNSPVVSGDTQLLGAYLYQQQLVPIQLAMLILTLAMTGAVVIARRKIYLGPVSPASKVGPEEVTGPATPTDDDPHTIPVYGTDDPRAKEYPQT